MTDAARGGGGLGALICGRTPLPAAPVATQDKSRVSQFMKRGSTGIVMQPVVSGGHCRVRMTWSGHASRFFGKFDSKAEAERWIAGHPWLTKQNLERQLVRRTTIKGRRLPPVVAQRPLTMHG